jgi:AraC family transcriptional regulator
METIELHIKNMVCSRCSYIVEQELKKLGIERVKEMLDDGELSLSQIASKLGYSSVHYLSAQFKKVTGVSATEYRKKLCEVERVSLHKV